MSQQAILWTLPAMVLLVAVVTFRMFFERKRQVAAEGIRMREIPSSSQMAARFADTRAADNYRNLFEMPVFFYAAVLTAYLNFVGFKIDIRCTTTTFGTRFTLIATVTAFIAT